MAPAPRAAETDTQWIVGVVLPLLFAGSLVYALGTAMIGWGNTLNDRHSFRQSQTATTAYWMIDEPFRLAYETPVLGKPWAVPLEFPLYQWIVARIVGLCGTPLDQTGRFVSLVFFFLTTVPLLRIVRSAGVPRTLAWVPATLFVVSPFYLFWGRTFMIELAATFCGVSYLCATLEARRGVATPWSALAIVAGSLAALVKITTFGVFLVACAGIACLEAWREWRVRSERPHAMRSIALWLAIPLIPTLVGVGWAHWSAGVRALNPIAGPYLTGAPASEWVYGTLAQKLSPQVWMVIFDRFVELIGYPPLAWLLLGAALAITLVAPRRWKETTACFACYLAGPAVFTNVYFVHDYYMNANGVFLIMALGFAIVGLLEHATTHRAGWCFFGLALCAAVAGHRVMHQPRQTIENAEILEAARYIQSATADDSVIVCVGQDWSPLVAYYARRRALMIPMDRNMDPLLVERALANLKGEKVSALVVIEPTAYSVTQIKRQMAEAGFDVPTLSVTGLPFR